MRFPISDHCANWHLSTKLKCVFAASGHYISHLLYHNEWYVANDVLPVTKLSSQTDARIDVERSSMFLFHRIAEEASQETEGEMFA